MFSAAPGNASLLSGNPSAQSPPASAALRPETSLALPAKLPPLITSSDAGYLSPRGLPQEHGSRFFPDPNPQEVPHAHFAAQALPPVHRLGDSSAGEVRASASGSDDVSPTTRDDGDQVFGSPMDPNSAVTPRKRSKVSRACDECRRKKIRCDATPESNLEQCTSCRKANIKCSFSRVPLKRGPSKGYIRDLADRLNNLENSMNSSDGAYDLHYGKPSLGGFTRIGDEGISPRASAELSPTSPRGFGPRIGRKRTHSAMDDLSPLYLSHTNVSPRSSTRLPSILGTQWQPEPPRHLPPPATPRESASEPVYRNQYPRANSFWKGAQVDFGHKPSVTFPYEADSRAPADVDVIKDWDDRLVDEYYELVHPTLPFLPTTKNRLRSRLANCPVTLRQAFVLALNSAVRTNSASKFKAPSALRQASDVLAASQFENSALRTLATNLIYLQTLIFFAIETDNNGPATAQGILGPPRSVWLGSAVGLAYQLKLHINKTHERSTMLDLDTDELLARRLWWTLVVLDRWHACSTSSPVLIPDHSTVLLPTDQLLLGPTAYHLARLSFIVGHLADIFTAGADILTPSGPATPIVSNLLRGEIERFRESYESEDHAVALLHLSYWHVKLLSRRNNVFTEPAELLNFAVRIASILSSPATPVTPLDHHFLAVASVTLIELSELQEIRERALKGIQSLHEALDRRQGSGHGHDTLPNWNSTVRDVLTKRRRVLGLSVSLSGSSGSGSASLPAVHGTLLHLADMAVGKDSSHAPAQLATPTSSSSMPASFPPPGAIAAAAASAPGSISISERDSAPSLAPYDFTMLTRVGYLTFLTT